MVNLEIMFPTEAGLHTRCQFPNDAGLDTRCKFPDDAGFTQKPGGVVSGLCPRGSSKG